MLLRDVVEINQQGLVADAVNLKMMADPEKNLLLCQGFVFNYDADKPKQSTLGVLDALRDSFFSANNPNVHLMIQDFGKGKSHFALTVANFFQCPADSPEVEGILNQIDFATAGRSQAICEKLRAYKQRSKPHLVLTISGEVGADLGKMLLQSLQSALEKYGVGDTVAQHFIQEPLHYLEKLSDEKRQKAEDYLASIHFSGDVATLIELLQEGQYDLIATVKDLSKQVEGFAIDFQLNLNIEAMLEDVVHNLCSGDNRKFEGILILFDELNAYLRTWLRNSTAAGGWALQNITNACTQLKGKLALCFFSQVKPSMDTAVPTMERKNYERFTTRIELAPSTYEPRSSLELVIDNLLKQSNDSLWQEFRTRWDSTLQGESRIAYDRYITAYSNRNWPFQEFHKHLGLGCYPLHPLTAYLLCNLEFTQGRTVIQFLKEDVARFIETHPVAHNGELNFVRPVQLMDAFASNFAQLASYSDYTKAYDAIAASASSEEVTMLKAIALFYLSGEKITKPANESHKELLSIMTGFSVNKTQSLLNKLVDDYQVIYYNSGNHTYRFYSGFSIADLRRKIEEDTENRTPSLNELHKHCRKNLAHYLGSETVRAESFVRNKNLNGEDWQFQRDVFTVDQFERILTSERSIRGLLEQGLIAYFIGEYDQDLEALEKEAEAILARAPQAIQERVIIAIPRRGTRDLARVLLMKQALSEKSTLEKQEFGPALAELTKQFDEQLDFELQEIFDSCIYTSHIIHKIPVANRKSLEGIVSKMLEELYPYVPPVEGQDKLRMRSNAGTQVISYVSRQLLGNDLKEPFPNQSYKNLIDPVFIRRWKILKSGSPYIVQVPQDVSIREAWDKISEMTDIGDREHTQIEIKKIWDVLSAPPFGHNELTFTLLFAAWLAYHRSEIELSGGFGIPRNKRESVAVKSAPLHEWSTTNILEKVKDFIQEWVIQGRSKVIRRKPLDIKIPDSATYDEAQSLINEIQSHSQLGVLEPAKLRKLEQDKRKLQEAVDAIERWLKPSQEVSKLLEQNAPLEALSKYYAPLEASPPLSMKEGTVNVRATETQRAFWTETKQSLRERLEALVEAIAATAQSFETVDDGYRCQAEIEQKLQTLTNIPELPSRFAESLRASGQAVEQRIVALKEGEKVRDRLDQIQKLYSTLGINASQNQYQTVLAQIYELAAQMPAVQEHEDYQRITDDINQKQDDLIQRISQWEDRFSPSITRPEALQLSEEINRELNRFDDEESRQQLNDLNTRIKNFILELDSAEVEESSLQAVVKQAQQKVKSVVSLKNLIDTMQAYDDLSQVTLPHASKSRNLEQYRQQIEQAQLEGRQAIEQKFEKLFLECDRELKRTEDYQQLRSYIQRAQKLIADHGEFVTLQQRLQSSEQVLEDKHTNLKKRLEDQVVLREIQQFKTSAGNTVLRCEQIVLEIESLRNRLNFPEQHQDTINRLISAFQGKRAEYTLQLDDLSKELQSVETLAQLQNLTNNLSKLEFVFKDSSESPRHEALQGSVQTLHEDLERIIALEMRYREVTSITTCDDVLEATGNEQITLHDLDRFRPRLLKLEEALQQHRQGYIQELTQLQTALENVSTSSQARKLQSQVASKAGQYKGSQYEETYHRLSSDLEQLNQLLAIADTQKTTSVEACQAEIDRLDDWKTTQETISPLVEQRLQTLKQSLLQTQQAIQTRQRNAAQQWLADLRAAMNQIIQIPDPKQKLRDATNLLKKIRQTRNQHETILEDDQKDTLRSLVQDCQAIQNQDRTSQIETLFQELPREQRLELYQRLAAYLENTTEVF